MALQRMLAVGVVIILFNACRTQTTAHFNTNLLENVEHCGGEPEQADRILMSDVTYSTFGVQCKLTQWNPH